MPLVIAGPEREPALADELRRRALTCAAMSKARAGRALPGSRLPRRALRATRASGCPCWRRWRAESRSSWLAIRRWWRSLPTRPSTPTRATSPAPSSVPWNAGEPTATAVDGTERGAVQLGGDGATDGRRLPGAPVTVAGVVVVHEPVPELAACLEALIPQVDELVVVDNLGGTVVQGVRVIENERPAGLRRRTRTAASPRRPRRRLSSVTPIPRPARARCRPPQLRRAPSARGDRWARAPSP